MLFDVLILGSGPAGLTASIYTLRAGYNTVVIAGNSIGGQLTTTSYIENFPGFVNPILGSELMDNMLKQSKNLGANIIYDNVISINFTEEPYSCVLSNGECLRAKNIIIAVGTKPRWLNVPGESQFIGHGVSSCAVCDGGFFKNKVVAVIGGGNSAAIEGLYLSNLAKKVYIIYRKSQFNKIAKSLENRLLTTANISSIFDTEITEIYGSNNVEGVVMINNKTKKQTKIDLDGIFIATGRIPQNDIFLNSGLALDANGYIITFNNGTRTNKKHVYACGDITNSSFKQAIIAAGSGAIAALEMQEDN